MPTGSITRFSGRNKPQAHQAALPLNLRRAVDMAVWLEENSQAFDPLLVSLARVVRRRLEAQIPLTDNQPLHPGGRA